MAGFTVVLINLHKGSEGYKISVTGVAHPEWYLAEEGVVHHTYTSMIVLECHIHRNTQSHSPSFNRRQIFDCFSLFFCTDNPKDGEQTARLGKVLSHLSSKEIMLSLVIGLRTIKLQILLQKLLVAVNGNFNTSKCANSV